MTYKFTIKGKLPALNEYIAAINHNRFGGNTFKKRTDMGIIADIKRQIPKVRITKMVDVDFVWVESDKRRDKDNIASAKKYVMDSLQKAGTLQGDGWAHINDFTDKFIVDKTNPRVEVTLREIES